MLQHRVARKIEGRPSSHLIDPVGVTAQLKSISHVSIPMVYSVIVNSPTAAGEEMQTLQSRPWFVSRQSHDCQFERRRKDDITFHHIGLEYK